jgi:two-component system LytT family sensor kinase
MNIPMLTTAAPDLLRIVGYLTGATLYAMLLVMVMRARGPDRLMIVAAICGLAWNLGELLVEGVRRLAPGGADVWLEAVSYSALGALAAVVIHSVTHEPNSPASALRRRVQKVLRTAAYVVAAVAGILHVVGAAADGIVPSRTGLVLLTAGLIVLAPALVLTTGWQAYGRRALWMTALTLVAVSALHLESPHRAGESWVLELVGHHASIPLAFAILYEDYRFVLADLFLKQAFTLIGLVTAVFVAWSAIVPSDAPLTSDRKALLLAVWIATALMFPMLRRSVTAFVDRFVLRRADYVRLMDRCTVTLQECDAEDLLLDRVCGLLAPAISASSVTWEPRKTSGAFPHKQPQEVEIQTTDVPQYVLIVGPLAGGRRLLSDDAAMLDRVAMQVARRIDALRITDERYERVMLEREMQALATEAELRALRAQVNPHFLFNALTTIGYLIQQAPPQALETLMRLTTLLRGVLRSEGEFTTLGHERELIECYLQIERERFEERLQVQIDIPDALNHLLIPALIVQPLVENAIKHGIAPVRDGGAVFVSARVNESAQWPGLSISVRNTGAPMRGRQSTGGGVGLRNVERRLECYYGNAARLDLRSDAACATIAELTLPLTDTVDQNATSTRRATIA